MKNININNISWGKEADDIAEITSEELERQWQEYLDTIKDFDIIKEQIITTLERLRKNVKIIESEYVTSGKYNTEEYWKTKKNKLDAIIDLIYTDFFELQNLINLYEGQQVKITYVHKDEQGQRQILLFDNTAAALATTEGHYGPFKFMKIGYQFPTHYEMLKNTLPDTSNAALQTTTQIAEERYAKAKRIIYWTSAGNKFNGYQLTNKGPINEAFVNFYLHTQPNKNYFRHDVERNVQTFVMHDRLGVRQADSLNGFLVGDVSKNMIQYAVKGDFGSPQGYKQVLKLLDQVNKNTTHQDLKEILKNFRAITQDRAHSLIKKASRSQLENLIKTLDIKTQST